MKTQYLTRYKLTSREFEVLELLTKGLTDKQIADKLIVSLSTVTSHKNKIYQKLGVDGAQSRVKAVVKFLCDCGIYKLVNIKALQNLAQKDMENLNKDFAKLHSELLAVQKENTRLQTQNRQLQTQLRAQR